MADEMRFTIHFQSSALDADTFRVIRFEGEEGISRPFRFELDLVASDPEVDLLAVLGKPALMEMGRAGEEPRRIHGIVSEFEQGAERPDHLYAYRAVLVPRLWLLSLSRQSQIYQDKNIPDIVEEELKGAEGKGPAELAAVGLGGDDYEFRLSGGAHAHPKREYVVQYKETDLNFVSRLLEHEGIFYFFEHGEQRERIVFCDDKVHLPPLEDVRKVPYQPPSGLASFEEESVHAFRHRACQVTGKVILKDYNYRQPQTPLQSEQEVDDKGHGLVSEYGDHFKVPEEGDYLVKVRAQERRAAKEIFEGSGDCMDFTAGNVFELRDHFRSDYDGEYLITSLRHAGGQSSVTVAADTATSPQDLSYTNEFTAIPAAVEYRPPFLTPRPRLYGVMNAHVDASGPGTRAEMDKDGRYKLVMPFDLSGAGEGKATRWVRMAQPYGGSNHGMHFPLLKGTEVLWSCIDGDPDRPIITGVVPNPLNRSVVNGDSRTMNRIRTASGSLIELNDGAGSGRQGGNAGGGGGQGGLLAQRQMQATQGVGTGSAVGASAGRMREQADAAGGDPGARPRKAPEAPLAPRSAPVDLHPQQQRQTLSTVSESDTAGTSDVWLKLSVPGGQSSYVRYGKHDSSTEDASGTGDTSTLNKDPATQQSLSTPVKLYLNNHANKPGELDHYLDGVLDFTSGNRTEVTMHNREVYIDGTSRFTIANGGMGVWDAGTAFVNYFRQTGTTVGGAQWRQTVVQNASSDEWQYGDAESGFAGFKFDGFGGLSTGCKLGGSLDLDVSAAVDAGIGFNVDMKHGWNVDFTAEDQNTLDAEDHDIIADKTISLRIKSPPEKAAGKIASKLSKRTLAALGVAFGAGLAGGAATAVGAGIETLGTKDSKSSWGSSIGFTLATAAWAAAVAYGVMKNRSVDAGQALSPAQLNIDDKGIELKAGQTSSIKITPTSITLAVGASKINLSARGVLVDGPKVLMTAKQQAALNSQGKLNLQGNLGVTIKGLKTEVI